MNLKTLRSDLTPMALKVLLLSVLFCVPLNADIVFSYNFYDVGTTNTITEPLNIGDMFDALISIEDTGPAVPAGSGVGVSGAAFLFSFDDSLLTQDAAAATSLPIPAAPWLNVGASAYNATGGRVDAFNISGPTFVGPRVILRTQYTATAAGIANFSTVGTGDPGNVFATYDDRGFDTNGNPGTASAAGQSVQFGAGSVSIGTPIPEPSGSIVLLLGLAGLVRRRRRNFN